MNERELLQLYLDGDPAVRAAVEGDRALLNVALSHRRLEAALRHGGMPKSEAVRLISEFKSSVGDPTGSGEGDPAERGPVADISQTAALAASLTSIL